MKQPTNPYPEDITPDGRCYGPARIWEDACRAYEEALKATGRYIPHSPLGAHWIVCIPDEEQEEKGMGTEKAKIVLDKALQRCQEFSYKDWSSQSVEELIRDTKTALNEEAQE